MSYSERARRTPRSTDEVSALLRERPDGWEYLLFTGSLLVGRDEFEESYRDHVLRYAPLVGEPLDAIAAIERLKSAFPDVLALTASLTRLFDAELQERAFGAPGEPGDAALIQHLARRMIQAYGALLDWARDLRSARVPEEFRHAFNLAADLAGNAIDELRDFIDDAVRKTDEIAAHVASASEEPLLVEMDLVVTVDERVREAFTTEIERLTTLGL